MCIRAGRGGERTDGDAGGLPAASSNSGLPDGVAQEESHEDLANEGRHGAVGRVDDVGPKVGGHVHFAREDHRENNGAEQAACHLGDKVGLKCTKVPSSFLQEYCTERTDWE